MITFAALNNKATRFVAKASVIIAIIIIPVMIFANYNASRIRLSSYYRLATHLGDYVVDNDFSPSSWDQFEVWSRGLGQRTPYNFSAAQRDLMVEWNMSKADIDLQSHLIIVRNPKLKRCEDSLNRYAITPVIIEKSLQKNQPLQPE